MKSPHISGLLALFTLCYVCTPSWSDAQVVSTVTNFTTGNFNTNKGWVSGTYVTGQNTNDPVAGRWQGNDPTVGDIGGTDYLTRVIGYTPGGSAVGNRTLVQGGVNAADGYVPGTTDVKLWRTFTPTASSMSDTVTFFIEWSLIGSLDVSYPDLDIFAFDLRDAANSASLVKFDLTPGIATIPNAYTMQWVSSAGTTNLVDLGYQGLYQLQVDLTGSTFDAQLTQINASTRQVLTNLTLITGGAVSDSYTALDFGTVGIDWELTSGDPNAPGSNYIVVNEVYSTTTGQVIPEPATWAVGAVLLSCVFASVYRRQRKSKVIGAV